MALFDAEAAKSFETIQKARNDILISARMLILYYGSVGENLKCQRRKWEANIGWGLTEDDDFARDIDEAVSAIEMVCKSAIFVASD